MELIIVGIISGMITGLGMGGGSVLILVLVSFLGISQPIAQSMNLLFYIPTAIIAIVIHIRNQNVEKQVAKKLFLCTVLGSGVGAYLTTFVDARHLKRYFEIFLLAVRNL